MMHRVCYLFMITLAGVNSYTFPPLCDSHCFSWFVLSAVRLGQSGMPKSVCSETLAAWWGPWTRRWACRSGAKGPTLPSQLCGSTPPTSLRRPTTSWSTPALSSPTIIRRSTSRSAPECGVSASCTTGVPWLRCTSSLHRWPSTNTSQYDKVRKPLHGSWSTFQLFERCTTQKWPLVEVFVQMVGPALHNSTSA